MNIKIKPHIEARQLGCFKRPVYRAGVLIDGRPYIDAALYGDPNGRVIGQQKRLQDELARRVREFACAEAVRLGMEPDRK